VNEPREPQDETPPPGKREPDPLEQWRDVEIGKTPPRFRQEKDSEFVSGGGCYTALMAILVAGGLLFGTCVLLVGR
jgi:hypothetical protein